MRAKASFLGGNGRLSVAILLGGALALAACDDTDDGTGGVAGSPSAVATQQPSYAPAGETETERLYAFFQQTFEEDLARWPMLQSTLGIKTDYGKWDNLSDAYAQEEHRLTLARLETLRSFDRDALDDSARLSYRIFEILAERDIAMFQFRFHRYQIDQMRGWQSRIPSFLINIHRVTSRADAEAYVERLDGVRPLMDQLIEQIRVREDKGVMPPKFVFPLVLGASRNVLTGAPFDDSGRDSTLYADFKAKVAALDLPQADKDALVAEAAAALNRSVKPAYQALIAELERQATVATTDDGAWNLPDGAAYYQLELESYTTTDLTATEIHDIGLANVSRIHDEMRDIMARVGFAGSLQDFFVFMRDDDRFYYPNTEEGKAAYLADARQMIERMEAKLPEYFGLLPKAGLDVKAVEPFRERSAGKAFYQIPALDGSRPGTYYANLYNMRDMPTYQMEALAYHEAVPGHHMQFAIAQELEGLPRFQMLARFTAYSEGWGLYSEYLPKEMGFYEDPYSDFGRLAMELWRACRLVVDTGLHHKRWTREQAIQYLRDNTPNPEGDIVKAIERYIVMPGQATAYLIGKQKILELRAEAKAELGEAFDIREFHDVVLKEGAVPLSVLADNVKAWTAAKAGS